jgi:two-component system nitrate/nitrite response regulator NarL
MKQNIRIMLIEDHPEYREVIELALNKEPDMELSGTFGSAEGALNRLQHGNVRTDVILLDLNLPGLNGLDALPLLVQAAPEAKVIILTQSDKESDVLRAITLGAAGYLLKSGSRRQITEGIRLVMAGGATLDAGVARFILKTVQTRLPQQQQAAKEALLSKREMEILSLLAEGLVQKEIALKLAISNTTVVTHINHIYQKLHVSNAPAAINKAHLSGLLST